MTSNEAVSVYSNAFNFDGFLSGGVDPRTGIYSCALTLAEIKSGALNGPSLPISLSFNPLKGGDAGLGTGWTMALTQYHLASEVLTLAGGGSYKAKQLAGTLFFEELKLETLKVTQPKPGHFDVIHKSGLREELKVYGASEIAVPIRIVAANGMAIMLDYTSINEQPVLKTVRDAQRTLLTVSRTQGRVTLTQYPGTDHEAKFVLSLTNDAVTAIHLPEGGSWKLLYEPFGKIDCLTQVDSPLGARELIQYQEAGHRLPPGSPIRSMPYVISHTVFPRQSQPAITKNYEYSQKNFLGFDDDNDDIRWSPDGDTLYQSSSDYQYTSTETLMSGARISCSTVRTYNKYHLLTSQVTASGQAITSESTEYHIDSGKSFQEQPAQLRQPKVRTVRYENRKTKTSRTETTRTEYDAMGNLLKHVGPEGVTTISEFYPADGADGCPPDPLGFVRFEKQRTVIPASGAGITTATVTRYRHALQPALQGALHAVLPVEEDFFERTASGETLCSKTGLVYFNRPDDALLHGLLQTQTVTQNGFSTRSEFSYALKGNQLELQTTVYGHDGTFKTSSRTLSAFSGLTLFEQNEDEGAFAFEYDAIGRLLSKTISPDTPHSVTSRKVYQAASSHEPASILTTDLMGVRQRVVYDGLGRVFKIEEQDCDSPDAAARTQMRVIHTARHDALGRLVEQTDIDWWDGIARPVRTGFVYDDWGQVKTTLHADGRKEHCELDPISRAETSWLEGMGESVTGLNDFGKPDWVEAFNLAGESLGKIVYEYDGVGRALSQTDAVGNKTTYVYDVFNRLCRSVLPDGCVVETAYAPHSHESLPSEVKVAGQSLGRQTFDGLGRMTESTVGGRAVSAGYEAGFGQPAWQKSASGELIEFDYALDFGGRLLQRKATGLLANFTYSPVHGQPQSCVEQGRESRFEYYPSGRLKHEVTVHGTQQRTATYSYSFSGRPLSCVDVLGDAHKTSYDEWGRVKSFEQNTLKADFVYNPLSLLERVESRDTQAGLSMVTRWAYDDLGREISRSFVAEGAAAQTLTSRYSLDGKLAQRVFAGGDELLRDERFQYDSRGRLSRYTCDGPQKPRDPFGKEIIQQTYAFDVLDNIVSLETEFPGGSNTTAFTYSPVDPAQLIEVRHSHADYPLPVRLHYDSNGQMIKDDLERSLSYDSLGRLTQIATATGAVIRGYHYDAQDRLVELSQPTGPLAQRFYQNGRVINEVVGDDRRTCLRQSGILLGEHQPGAGVKLFGTDQQQSVLTLFSDNQRDAVAYSPYGYRPAEGGLFHLTGFNGEQLDPLTGLYLLGNGYRAYSPTLMRFLSPDSLSPFAAGGLNSYAYCLGDPINRVDPSGHVSWQSGLGVALSVFSIAASILTFGAATPLAIASFTLAAASGVAGIASSIAHEVAPQSEVGDILGYVSLGLGLASFASGLGAVTRGASKVAGAFKSGLSSDSREAARAMASGMSGRTARAGSSTGLAEATSVRWAYKTYNSQRNIPGFESLDDASRAKFFRFKDAVKDEGMTPSQAAEQLGGKTYYNEMVPFKSANPRQLREPGYFNDTGYTEIRLNQATRLFFYANNDTRTATMFKFGHTVRGG
ncbi:RHS repeat domain-containing protein [Pseudomonas sp. PD9R]|uniref:RHS repeat domain-containing protein n=1 Tax=Pseudomonas sp. PD9R TaxID=2853534 RepID=UPI001C44FE76|nr:RHS repeat-associated core domain-containing protein [Pseudomonas sp. PD9R]MBV6826058.1 type IV secretion protein Rhs [Pseudomonas sp. PD9R]